MNEKASLRKKFIAERKNINPGYRALASLAAAQHLVTHPLFQSSQHIACYYPLSDEFDSLPLIETIWMNNKKCYLPVMAKDKNPLIHFVPYHPGDLLRSNRYSIHEPIHTELIISPKDLDMVIVPLLSFDCLGHRLGVGGGYYDCTFSYLLSMKKEANHLVGLAYAQQEADYLPSDAWDVPIHNVITEKGVKFL